MTARRPSKPWKVAINGQVVPAVKTFTSESKAYTFIRATLVETSPATTARVEHWEYGRWVWWETVTKEEVV